MIRRVGSIDQQIQSIENTSLFYLQALVEQVKHMLSKHNIHFLAPSSAAAALIDGMTIHKGLFIKVGKKGKGKGNQVPGEPEDYGIIMNVSDK